MSEPGDKPPEQLREGGEEKEIIFVSYTWTNGDTARWIATTLHREGYRVIFQEATFRKDRSFISEMEDALRTGGRVLALLSPAYGASHYCKDEWQVAHQTEHREKRGALLTIRIADFTPDGILALYPYADLVGVTDEAAAWGILMEHICPPAPFTRPAPFRAVAKTPAPAQHFFTPTAEAQFPDHLRRPPLPENKHLTDREREIAKFDTILAARDGGHAPQGVVLTGQGGLGKTQLAVTFAHHIQGRFQPILLVNAETPDALRDNLSALACAAWLGIPGAEGMSTADGFAAVRGWLIANPRWLLILENVDSQDSAHAVCELIEGAGQIPMLHHRGLVLITARWDSWQASYERIPLRHFTPETGAAFLRQRIGHDAGTDADARRLCELFGGLPLAIEQAAACIQRTRDTFAHYTKDILDGTPRLAEDDLSGTTRYELAADATWRKSLRHAGPLARHLFHICAHFAADDIPRSLLTEPGKKEHPPEGNADDALGELASLSLFQLTTAALSIHRTIHSPLYRDLEEGERAGWLRIALERLLVAASQVTPSFQYEHWPRWATLLPHVLTTLDAAEASGDDTKLVGFLCHEAGNYLAQRADFARAEPLLRRSLALDEKHHGPEHRGTLTSINNLAYLLQSKGDLAGVEPLYRRALEGCERTLGPEHPDTLRSVNNLAALLDSKGDLAGAEPLYRRALEASERTLGPEHPATLISVNNLGYLLRSKGDLAGAEPLYRRALEARERTLGPEHPATLTSINNLAALLRSKGDLAGAEPLYLRAVQGFKRTLGPEHPATLSSVNNLAAFLESKGDLAGAEPLFRRVLEAQERTLGPEHPDTLMSLNNLATLRYRQGRLKEAEELLLRAVAGRERVLGVGHPDTVQAKESLKNLREELEKVGGRG